VLLDGREVSSLLRTEVAGAAHRASRPGPPSAMPCSNVNAPLPNPRSDRRRQRHGHRGFPERRAQNLPHRDSEERARRRYKQLKDKDSSVTLAALSLDIAERDRNDMTRSVAPLVPAADAIVLDSTAMDANG